MANYDNYDNPRNNRDLVLASNEFCYLQSKTNGIIKTHSGPTTVTISAQESLVVFNPISKQFQETPNPEKAKNLFVSAPENWYVVLKNPAPANTHPETGKAVISPDLEIGKKINVQGPCSFSLFPGQMAKVVRGHRLRTNQYLMARVYEAHAANNNRGEMRDAEGNKVEDNNKYVNGQILIIKGTEVSFYIPPTGIEVIPVGGSGDEYVREAITLERLEYCILKDEDGTKEYVHGPAVVFPKPTETFVQAPGNKGYIFRAIELSPISGIYVKVIAAYKDENGVEHPAGEELFITGNDQMIYYPRPEHAVINYDGKTMHHAIAIPKGEGRYIMNRLTGDIKTVKGPAMYLPDPRTEVVVKRKLTDNQCRLWYPGNDEALAYNRGLTEKSVEKRAASTDSLMAMTATNSKSLANFETNASIARGTSYTKPRTITLDTKYDGVVSMDVWNGYAVNIVSKNGDRQVICGPQTILLDYDQVLEVLVNSENQKGREQTVFLRHSDNKFIDTFSVETSDHTRVNLTLVYFVNFDPANKNKWFDVDDYAKLCRNKMHSEVKRAVKNYTIEEFYNNYSTILYEIATDSVPTEDCERGETLRPFGRYFVENGMYIYNCEVISVDVENSVRDMLEEHNMEVIQKSLELNDAERRITVANALAIAQKKEQEIENQIAVHKMKLQEIEATGKMEIQSKLNRMSEEEAIAKQTAERELQSIMDMIAEAQLKREEAKINLRLMEKQREAEIEKARQEAYAETVAKVMGSISEDLVAAMNSKSNADMTVAISQAVAPYALARDESAADVVNKLLKGTTLENIVENFKFNNN